MMILIDEEEEEKEKESGALDDCLRMYTQIQQHPNPPASSIGSHQYCGYDEKKTSHFLFIKEKHKNQRKKKEKHALFQSSNWKSEQPDHLRLIIIITIRIMTMMILLSIFFLFLLLFSLNSYDRFYQIHNFSICIIIDYWPYK